MFYSKNDYYTWITIEGAPNLYVPVIGHSLTDAVDRLDIGLYFQGG